MTQFEGPSIAVVAEMLAARVEAFCRDWLPHGVKSGGYWRCGDAQGAAGGSLAVHLHGAKAGHWADYSFARGEPGAGGDLIDLICANHGISKGDAFREAKKWLGIDDRTGRESTVRHAEASAAKRLEHKREDLDSETRAKIMKARDIKNTTIEGAGTVVEAYLRGRAIALPVPDALRLRPTLLHVPSGRMLPCMVGVIWTPVMKPDPEKPAEEKLTYEVRAVHRTWLEVKEIAQINFLLDSHVKALGATATVRRLKHLDAKGNDSGKMGLGPWSGGFIPLTPGPVKSTLIIAEGIENGLSLAQAWGKAGDVSAWSALNAGNMIKLLIPRAVRRVIFCADADSGTAKHKDGSARLDADGKPFKPADVALRKAAQQAKDMAADDGRQLDVDIWHPDPGKDANDMLREGTL